MLWKVWFGSVGPRGVNPVKPPWPSGYTGVLSRKVSVCTAGAEEEVGDGEEEDEGVAGRFEEGDGEEEGDVPGWHCQK